MSFEAARKNIMAHFSSNFSGVAADKIAWDNVAFKPVTGSPWVRVSIQGNLNNFASIGGPSIKVRRLGIVFVQVFVPEGTGTLVADQLADDIADALEAKQLLTGETFQASTKTEAGANNGWYQLNVSTPFYFDEQRTL